MRWFPIHNQMRFLLLLTVLSFFAACKKGVKQKEDELYSRHLQRHVTLTIIATRPPDEISDYNLLICNDGQLLNRLGVQAVTDSLYKKKRLLPLIIVGIHAGNRMDEFGIADKAGKANEGGKANHYDSFLNNELYPYAKKMAGVRKFKSVSIAGFGAGALSALDFAWDHADKINKAGVFSGAFSRMEKNIAPDDSSAYGIMYDKLKSSRKRPKLQYWFYAGQAGSPDIAGDDAKEIYPYTNQVIEVLKRKSFIAGGDIVFEQGEKNDIKTWRQLFPEFLEWAFGR